MATIENLNSKYTDSLETLGTLRMYEKMINEVQESRKLSDDEKMLNSFDYFYDLDKAISCNEFERLHDILIIAKHYNAVDAAISNFKASFLKSDDEQKSAINNLSDKQNTYNICKTKFEEKYKVNISTAKEINRAICETMNLTVAAAKENISKLQEEAKQLLAKQVTIELKDTDPINSSTNLPEDMLVANYMVSGTNLKILEDIGTKQSNQNLRINLKDKGNVFLHTDFRHLSDEAIDDFVIAYVFRFLESFPLGSANVHVFDANASHLYRRMCNCFQADNNREITKNVIQLHSDNKDLERFRDVHCEDIFKKIGSRRDLYELYETDKTDPFNLVILRRGLVDGNGYASSDTLSLIKLLSDNADTGHRCGIRFLIVDGGNHNDKSISENNLYQIRQIVRNCELVMHYKDERFYTENKPINVLYHINSNDQFIQKRAQKLAEEINRTENNFVPLTDVFNNDKFVPIENIIRIPVGKSADEMIELPLSCKDEAGTADGSCVGYMVIGQTGSGKSSLFDSIVLNGCRKYSPNDLQFWLLDFKFGGASSKYRDSGIPHIRYIAENNNLDDAFCLFQMVLEEMENRTNAFNKVHTSDIFSYNQIAKKKNLEHFPRIIIEIDEIQEILREGQHGELKKLIASISGKMRASGIHFIMFAQNLAETYSGILKEAFLPSASGRICFRVDPRIPAESSFGEEFVQRKHEIANLQRGEAYISYGKNIIKKTRIAYVSPEEMNDTYFSETVPCAVRTVRQSH